MASSSRRLLSAPAYADLRGLDRSSVTRMIARRGMPARREGRHWMLDVQETDEWIRRHAPRAWNQIAAQIAPTIAPTIAPEPHPSHAIGASARASTNGDEARLQRIDRLIDTTIDALTQAYDPRAVAGLKQLSSERRMIERDARADRDYIARAEHERALAELARMAADEISSAAGPAAEVVLAALAAAGVVPDDPGRALQAATAALEQQMERTRGAIADAVAASGLR